MLLSDKFVYEIAHIKNDQISDMHSRTCIQHHLSLFKRFYLDPDAICHGQQQFPVRSNLHCASESARRGSGTFQVTTSGDGYKSCLLCDRVENSSWENGYCTFIKKIPWQYRKDCNVCRSWYLATEWSDTIELRVNKFSLDIACIVHELGRRTTYCVTQWRTVEWTTNIARSSIKKNQGVQFNDMHIHVHGAI